MLNNIELWFTLLKLVQYLTQCISISAIYRVAYKSHYVSFVAHDLIEKRCGSNIAGHWLSMEWSQLGIHFSLGMYAKSVQHEIGADKSQNLDCKCTKNKRPIESRQNREQTQHKSFHIRLHRISIWPCSTTKMLNFRNWYWRQKELFNGNANGCKRIFYTRN